ncbi:MAG TPA: beta-galactosidase trimerization domain-containing protein [Armatimonadota bacterium]
MEQQITSSTDITSLPLPAWATTRGRIYFYDQYANNEQATAFSQYDPDRITAELVGTGADIVVIYACNQFSVAYYPSAIWPQHPGLRGRDYVGDLITRLHAQGKKVITYFNWLESKHPEWNMMPVDDPPSEPAYPLASWADPAQPNGRVQALPGGHWQTPCINSPKRAQVVAIARELLERYHPDGIHLDMFFNNQPCVCPCCRPALEAICGTTELTLETIHAHWRDYVDWHGARSAALVCELTDLAHQYGAIGAHNGFAPLVCSPQLGQTAAWLPALDVFTSECFDAFGTYGTDLNFASINVRWQRAVGKPPWILRTSTPIHYAHWPITSAQWTVYAAACKANGCKAFGPCGVGARPDTTSAQELLENVKGGFDVFMADADLDESAEPATNVGVLFSWATRQYTLPTEPMQWSDELNGWARLLIEEHVPFEFVTAERINHVNDLTGYQVLILPDAIQLSDQCCSILAQFVRNGGQLIATDGTSLGDGTGRPRANFGLADVLGIDWQGRQEGDFALSGHREAEPASGGYHRVTVTGEALAQLVDVDPAGSVAAMKDPLPMEPTSWPAFTRHRFGQGSAYYIAFSIGRYFNLHGDQHIGARMRELFDAAQPERQLRLHAPRTVEVTLWRQPPARTIIHLVNRTVPWSLPTDARAFTEVIPVHGIEVTMPSPYPHARVTCRGAEVTVNMADNRLVMHIDALDAYAALVIEARYMIPEQ